jgi:uncharacterized protein YunC (DUF1805 family)
MDAGTCKPIVNVRLTVVVCCGALESVTRNVKGVLATEVVGVPVMSPLNAFRLRPAGRAPEISVQL